MKKNTTVTFGKSFSILAAAALSMTLIGGQALPTYAGSSSSGIESGAVLPDNITIDSPTALSNVALPSNSYGSLSWVDGSYVPDKRVQSCAVVFKPSSGADLSGLPGWDSTSGTLTGYVTVVVSSLDSSQEESGSTEENSDAGDSYDGADSCEKEGYRENENSEETSDEQPEDSSTEDQNTENSESSDNSGDAENGKENNKNSADITETDTSDDRDSSGDDKTETADAESGTEETPEATVTPSGKENENNQDKEADADEIPEATVTPTEEKGKADDASDTAKEDSGKYSDKDSKEETPEVTEAPEEDKDNIFDRQEEKEDESSQSAETADLTEAEKEQIAAQNHTCNGITVSGIDLPWYVQFRVSGGEDYEFTNEEDATIFKSYEFELWDTQNNTEYEIPDGEYVSVTVPVKAGYTYSIEHLLDSGAMETIIPSVDGGTMTFSTHSFSPFGIAGSKSLVGPDAETDSSSDTAKNTSSADSSEASDTTGTDGTESLESSDGSDSVADLDTSADLSTGTVKLEEDSSQSSDGDDEATDEASQAVSKKQVNTGDNTQILPFVILFAAAAVVAGVAVFFKKRKK